MADRRTRSVCLDLDWFFGKLRSGAIAPWKPEAHAQNRTVLTAAAAALAAFVDGGYDTVGEGIIYPFMLDLFDAACAPAGVEVHYAVLRAPRAVIHQRVRDRTTEPEHFGALADEVVVDDLWDQFERHGVPERHRVDADGQSPSEMATVLDRRWRAGDFRLGD